MRRVYLLYGIIVDVTAASPQFQVLVVQRAGGSVASAGVLSGISIGIGLNASHQIKAGASVL